MATKRQRNDFINFIMDAGHDIKLADRFMSKKTAKALYSFFQDEGYKDIPYNDCTDILMARKRLGGTCIPRPGGHPCEGIIRYGKFGY